MPGKTTASLSPEVEKRIVEIERMTLTEVQRVLMECVSDLPTAKITAKESNALSRAANTGIQAIQREPFGKPKCR